MGWTSYEAKYFNKSGTINRKKECDAYFEEGLNSGYYKVMKSSIKGSIYYAAIKGLKRYKKDEFGKIEKDDFGKEIVEAIPNKEQVIFGVVFRTAVSGTKTFYYKPITEDMGPCYYDCPKNILDILSPTENKTALEWRDKCYKKISKPSLGKLPIGTKIKFESNGKEIILTKKEPSYQFKTPWWHCESTNTYFIKKLIPENFTVVS